MKEFKIIVHNDLDGGASAICIINHIRFKYGENSKYSVKFCTYNNVNTYVEQVLNNSNKFEKVFIADISVEKYLADVFPNNFILLDHHDTADVLNENNKCIVDTTGKNCGASLCYKHLLLKENLPFDHLKTLVAIAYDYDLWKHKLPNKVAKNLNNLYYHYWGEKFIKRFVNGFDGFNSEEKALLREKWIKIEEDINNTEIIDVLNDEDEKYRKYIAFATLPSRNAELNEIAEYALNELGYSIIVIDVPKEHKISIRANETLAEKGFHVGKFNESWSDIGGGHERAGGLTYSDKEHLQGIVSDLAEKIIELLL